MNSSGITQRIFDFAGAITGGLRGGLAHMSVFSSIIKEIIPFILILIVVLLLCTYVPDIVLFLPGLFGYFSPLP